MQPSGDQPVIISFRPELLLGWGITLALCVVPVILWLQLHPLSTVQTFPAIMLGLGRLTGLIGMVMYSLNLVYATRLRFLETLFGGLNRVYIAHHLLGGFALIFLSFHPLFLALRYIKVSLFQAALILVPNGLSPISALFDTSNTQHGAVLAHWTMFFGIISFWVMVGLLLVTFFIKIPYHIWLYSHKFLGVAFFLAGLHVFFTTSDTTPDGIMRYYMLSLTAIGIAAFIYRTIAGRILIRHFLYRVELLEVSAENVTQLIMSPVKQKMPYKPGQFVFIRFFHAGSPGIRQEWHPFSISSAPNDQYLRFSIKGLGDYTNTLSKLATGTIAVIEGAYGKFSYTNYGNTNQIWIAGGIGISPFLSMARTMPDKGYHVDLYYSVKTASELIDWTELSEIASMRKDSFRVIPYIGDQQKGFLTADFIEKNSRSLEGKDIYICGPPAMMKNLRQQFKKKQVPGTSIHSEEFAMS